MVVLMIGLVSAGTQICVDFDDPSAPANLSVSSSGTDILLNWEAAVDEPSCSGIDYYVISRNGVHIDENVVLLTYTDLSVPYGSYNYTVFAVDKIGHNSGPAIKNDVVLSEPDDGEDTHVGGGSSTSSHVCTENWTCEEWTECVGDEQKRICTDVNECGTEKIKPETYVSCGVSSGSETESENSTFIDSGVEEGDGEGFFSAITGNVIGTVGTPQGIAGLIFVILIIGGLIIVIVKKRRK